MTAEDVIDQARAALEGTTEGPWTWDEDSEYLIDPRGEQVPSHPRANTDFIATARELVPALIALAEEQAATIARVRALVTGGEQREATSLTRMFNGDPFPALFTTADIRAALDGEADQ